MTLRPDNPLELEAKTRKYSDDVWHFIQLKDGTYAVYNHERALVACGISFELMQDLYLHRLPVLRKEPQYSPRPSKSSFDDTLTLDDLDL